MTAEQIGSLIVLPILGIIALRGIWPHVPRLEPDENAAADDE